MIERHYHYKVRPAAPMCEEHVFRIKIPFTYGDQLFRIFIYRWEGQDWWWSVNSHRSPHTFKTVEEAAQGAIEALGDIARALSSISVNDLISVRNPASLPLPTRGMK